MARMDTIQYSLPQSRIPQAWYNIVADLPEPMPAVLHPGTLQPIGPDDLAPLFPMSLIQQEVSTEREIEIPGEVRQVYAQWRPSPLHRARRLERALDTPARIYFKYEGVSPAGSHKPNSAVAQAWYNKQDGTRRLVTETGAGQWGSALALACQFFGLECKVYMVRVSYDQKPYRRALMEAFGASVTASPSIETQTGRAILAQDPDCNGSLGMAISEAVEVAAQDPHTKYALGSVLNHVLLHQTVIGLEAIEQMAMADDEPDILIGCTGGGSNFAGLVMPYLGRKIKGHASNPRVIAVEPAACPSLTRGRYTYDFGDTGHLTPLVKMHTLGSTFVPPGIHAGGLRYHGMAPLVSQLCDAGLIEAVSYPQLPVFEAAVQFAREEGIIPAPESSHAIRAVIDEAVKAKEEQEERVILFNLSGNGFLDLSAYDSYFAGELA
jgi:tryptophan synthase beta chain